MKKNKISLPFKNISAKLLLKILFTISLKREEFFAFFPACYEIPLKNYYQISVTSVR